MNVYHEQKDAIKTTWMILEGLGISREQNSGLEKVVQQVFDTCPKYAPTGPLVCLDGKCGSCKYFKYESENAQTGICTGPKKHKSRLWQSHHCKDYIAR